ncbi:Mannose permease IID component [Desulfuromonas sp. DDH964]|nr:Mannose permease IID component [Desulfuromonas sp. DDH964]
MVNRELPGAVLVAVMLRSFLLQASWNFERMQNLGVIFTLAPALRLLFRGEALVQAYQRHLVYFNTHPYFAGPVFGATLALEEDAGRGGAASPGVAEFKGMIMAPYAAIGDALFWGGLRPLAAGVALFIAVKGSLWAPLVFLILFNLPHLGLRCLGLVQGYRLGMGLVAFIQRFQLPDLAVRCKEATVVLLGVLSGFLVYSACHRQEVSELWGFFLLAPVYLLTVLARRGWSALLLVILVTALVLALAAMAVS